MTISILDAGSIGTAIATFLTRNGIAVSIANSRGPDSLSALVAVNWSKLTAA